MLLSWLAHLAHCLVVEVLALGRAISEYLRVPQESLFIQPVRSQADVPFLPDCKRHTAAQLLWPNASCPGLLPAKRCLLLRRKPPPCIAVWSRPWPTPPCPFPDSFFFIDHLSFHPPCTSWLLHSGLPGRTVGAGPRQVQRPQDGMWSQHSCPRPRASACSLCSPLSSPLALGLKVGLQFSSRIHWATTAFDRSAVLGSPGSVSCIISWNPHKLRGWRLFYES